jgi:radical SAM superfamily enzyme YgiQ (UPF0313 family)
LFQCGKQKEKAEKAMRYLFIYPDFLDHTKFDKNVPGNYSEGLAMISAVLKNAGHEVFLYHVTYMPDKAEFIDKVKSYNAAMYGIVVRTTAVPYVQEFVGWLDDELPDIPVMAGSYHATLAPEEIIAMRGIDIVCVGEGEFPTLDLVNAYALDGKLKTDITSLWFKTENGEVIQNPVRPLIEDLDELPFPDLDLFDFSSLRSSRINSGLVMVSRGCLYSCTYCGNPHFREKYPNSKKYCRFRSPDNAIELLQRVVEKQPNIKFFEFNDAILNMYTDWFYEFMPKFKEKIGLQFSCNLRFDHVDEKMCQTLGECGCYLITIGLESGNEAFRTKYLHRSMKNAHMIDVTRWLQEAGIPVYTYNIVGLPHETLELSLETIKLNARMKADKVVLATFYPYPATTLRTIATEAGFIDPTVDPNDEVQLRMPQYSRDDVLYAKYRFLPLMEKYKKIYALKDANQQAAKEKRLDKKILSKTHPRAFIWRMHSFGHFTLLKIKRISARLLPNVYRKLRQRKYKTLKV